MLAASVAINVGLHLTARSGVETVWMHDGRFLRGVQGADSWKPMETARAYTRSHASGLYEQVFFADAVKFQYPPTALLVFGALERPTLNRISWLATLIAAGLVAVILRRAVAAAWGEHGWPPGAALAVDLLVVVAALHLLSVHQGVQPRSDPGLAEPGVRGGDPGVDDRRARRRRRDARPDVPGETDLRAVVRVGRAASRVAVRRLRSRRPLRRGSPYRCGATACTTTSSTCACCRTSGGGEKPSTRTSRSTAR